jgi:class 3 adenylate cyclase
MSWSRQRSERRIRDSLQSVPSGHIEILEFDQGFLDARRVQMQEEASLGLSQGSPIVRIPPSKAMLVHGVHVYVQLVDYHSALVELDRETEASHRRALELLHLHYSGCDRVVEAFEAQKVDYHGPRLHAVILTPTGAAMEAERAARAVAFAVTIKRVIEAAGASIGGGQLQTKVRIGIDTGAAVAVNSGRSDEQEPLFLGNPANYAAKLADGDAAGIFLSDRARLALGLVPVGSLLDERRHMLDVSQFGQLLRNTRGLHTAQAYAPVEQARLMTIVSTLLEDAASRTSFAFRHHEPPLRTIRFSELMPSRSIRMPLASVFADIGGFTGYVSDCIAQSRVQEMVLNLHTIRRELAAVLKEDFDGRKIRFIGDCLHGVLAVGSRSDTDETETVKRAVLCAGGLRSAFELCQHLLPGASRLGLAIGIELGPTPITRLGTRGERSVRCVASKAVSWSESCQGRCKGTETALGPRALERAPVRMRREFGEDGVMAGLDYAAAELLFIASPTVVTKSGLEAEFNPHARS